MTTVTVALLNTVFRFATITILTPAIPLLERIVCLLFPDPPEHAAQTAEFDSLEDRFVQHPSLAIEQSRIVINSMAAKAQEDDGEPFEEKMRRLTATLREQQAEAAKLDAAIAAKLESLGFGDGSR